MPVAPHRVLEGLALGVNLLVDSIEAIAAIEAAAPPAPAGVFLKVDCGGRAGVLPNTPRAVMLAERLHCSPFIRFLGLLTMGATAMTALTLKRYDGWLSRNGTRSLASPLTCAPSGFHVSR